MMFHSKAFLFDMDGTLVDNCAWHVKAWLEFARRHGCSLTEEQVLAWLGATNAEYLRRMFGRDVSEQEAREFEEEKEGLYRELYAPHMKAPDGLAELLAYAKSANIKCAVATGGPKENAEFILQGLGIAGYFDATVCAGMYRRSKPDPECYLLAAKLLNVPPEECAVFEDAIGGIVAGKRAGMKVVAIAQTLPKEKLLEAAPDVVIGSFRELRNRI